MPQTFGALEISPSWFYFAAPVAGVLIVLYWLEKLLDPRFRMPDGEVHL
jgi:TRAP-type C4-dicarboxylate transport system permease small subunit